MTDQKTEDICLELKNAREASGLSLKDLFLRTRISVINLEAIEKADFLHLPEPIYTRNFIKIYAGALGLDSEPVLQRYEAYLKHLKNEASVEIKDVPEKPSFSDRLRAYKIYLLMVALVVVFIAIALFISMQYEPPANLVQTPTSETTPASPAPVVQTTAPAGVAHQLGTVTPPIAIQTKQPDVVAAPQEINKKVKPPQPPVVAAQKPLTAPAPAAQKTADKKQSVLEENDEETGSLIVRATEETWIRLKTDQKPSFQVVLKPGEKIERKATHLEMDIGNAGGVKIQFKGKTIENLGKSGQVIHLRLP